MGMAGPPPNLTFAWSSANNGENKHAIAGQTARA